MKSCVLNGIPLVIDSSPDASRLWLLVRLLKFEIHPGSKKMEALPQGALSGAVLNLFLRLWRPCPWNYGHCGCGLLTRICSFPREAGAKSMGVSCGALWEP